MVPPMVSTIEIAPVTCTDSLVSPETVASVTAEPGVQSARAIDLG